MAIKLGNNSIDKVYLGDTEVTKLYLGDNLVFGGGEAQPIITLQPVNVTVTEPDSATLTMSASDALTYQWYTSVDDQPVVGETGTSLVIDPTSESISGYYCIATNVTLSAQTDTAIVTVEAVAADCVLYFDGTNYGQLPDRTLSGQSTYSVTFKCDATPVNDYTFGGTKLYVGISPSLEFLFLVNNYGEIAIPGAELGVKYKLSLELVGDTNETNYYVDNTLVYNQSGHDNKRTFLDIGLGARNTSGHYRLIDGYVYETKFVSDEGAFTYAVNSQRTDYEPCVEFPDNRAEDCTLVSVAPEDWECPVALEALVDDNGEGLADDSGELLGAEIV